MPRRPRPLRARPAWVAALTPYRKLIAALVAAATEAVALGVLDAKLLAVAVAFLGAAGVYAVPNEVA